MEDDPEKLRYIIIFRELMKRLPIAKKIFLELSGIQGDITVEYARNRFKHLNDQQFVHIIDRMKANQVLTLGNYRPKPPGGRKFPHVRGYTMIRIKHENFWTGYLRIKLLEELEWRGTDLYPEDRVAR